MLPFRLKPVLKNYLWGGEKLISSWGKESCAGPLAESWELAAHKDGDNLILDGELKNFTLSEAVKRNPEIAAKNFNPENIFPLMVKLIDSAQPLSIQVHPDDDYAQRVENSKGKTELWYILDHEPDAFIYLGFKKEITRSEFEQAIKNNALLEILNKIKVHSGDSFFIPAGTVHSIGAGITLAEIQENSNITYRVYDYGRAGADGKPRELHIAKALDVAKTCPANLAVPGSSKNFIVDCENFSVKKLNITNSFTEKKNFNSFRFLLCLSGKINLACRNFECEISRGGNIFIPADCEEDIYIKGNGEILSVW